jgi:hypothetical protein
MKRPAAAWLERQHVAGRRRHVTEFMWFYVQFNELLHFTPFWDVTPCSLLRAGTHFPEKCIVDVSV